MHVMQLSQCSAMWVLKVTGLSARRCLQDTSRLIRLRAARVVLHSLVAKGHEGLAVIARRWREVIRDLAVLRALLAQGTERFLPRPCRAAAAAPGSPRRPGADGSCCKNRL